MHELIYNNFDGLDVTFQGVLPQSVLTVLEAAKTQAQEERREVLIEIGQANIPVMVAETGAQGGYRYRFKAGGADGETWFAMHTDKKDQWGIRVSVSSLALALHGYRAVKERLIARLIEFGAIRMQTVAGHPIERIGRFDYCFDFIMDQNFEPCPTDFIAHRRCKKQSWGRMETAIENPIENLEENSVQNTIACYVGTTGDRTETITIGMINGRQVTLYNKSRETKAHDKAYWWDIWNKDKEVYKNRVWRIEVRMGKRELRKWGVRTFADFEAKAGDVVVDILSSIRYTFPSNDTNRSRQPSAPFWQSAIVAAEDVLAPYRSHAKRENIIAGMKQDIVNNRRNHIQGAMIGLIAAEERPIAALPAVIDAFHRAMITAWCEHPALFERKHSRAAERIRFIDTL